MQSLYTYTEFSEGLPILLHAWYGWYGCNHSNPQVFCYRVLMLARPVNYLRLAHVRFSAYKTGGVSLSSWA